MEPRRLDKKQRIATQFMNMNTDMTSANKLTILVLLTSSVGGSDSAIINGALHSDVLLPCNGTYYGAFMLNELVINWQRAENDDVVHSFFFKADQPRYQDKQYERRTQLFHEEFHKGNASLLLKDLRASDAGNYTCHYFLHDKEGYTVQYVELLVQDEEIDNSGAKDRRMFYLILLATATLVIAVVIFVLFRRNQKKRKPEDEELLQENSELHVAIENYRQKIQNSLKIVCNSLSSEREKQDGCLRRKLHTKSGSNVHVDICKNKLQGSKMKEKEPQGTGYMFEEKESAIDSADLFTDKTKKFISSRMLIVGAAGIGKSWICKGFQKQWASGQMEIYYMCIIYITFSELNAIKGHISMSELLKCKCPALSNVLTDLLNKRKVLIILDGLDEFNHSLEDSQPSKRCDIDTPLDISTLISNVIFKKLLTNDDVLVTSRLSSVDKIREQFTSTFIMEEFTVEQITDYCQKFMPGDGISKSISDFIKTHNLSSLVSIPLLSSTFCEMYRKGICPHYESELTTCSRMMFSLLQISLRDTLVQTGYLDKKCCMRNNDYQLPENIRNAIHQFCKISYDNLNSGVLEIKSTFIEVGSLTKLHLKNFSEFFCIEGSSEDKLIYRHASIRDMFAALYWVGKIQDMKELKIQLDEWAFGNNWKRFKSFIQFFVGLFHYKESCFLFEQSLPSKAKTDFLKKWFQEWIARGQENIYLLNLLHCAFELHNDDVTKDISRYIKNVCLFNIPLDSLDIRVLLYCYQNSAIDMVDLRLCGLGDHGLEQLQTVIRNCKVVWISSNKLTEKSGKVLKDLLEHNECAIENLSLGTNRLGSDGAKHLFEGLEKNSSLKTLSLKDNNIDDSGIEHMARSLQSNKALQTLYLCMNFFGDTGIKKIKELQQNRPNLSIVIRIAEDEEVLRYTEEKVESVLSSGWDQYKTTWLVQLLRNVLKDLREDEHINNSVKDRVKKLKQNISKLLQKMEPERENKVHGPKV